MKLTIISNPVSGRQKHQEYMKVALDVLKSNGIQPLIRETTQRGDASLFSREEAGKGTEIVLVAGGDGTINEVANGLVGSSVKLAVLPLGTANVFALETGIPTNPREAVNILLKGYSRPITLGHVTFRDLWDKGNGETCFLLMAGIGFDGGVLIEIKRKTITRWGRAAYFATAIKVLSKYTNSPLSISIDQKESITGYSVIIGNGRYYGGKFQITPHASLTENALDVCVLRRKGVLGVLGTACKVLMGTQSSGSDRFYGKAKTIAIDSPDVVYVQADGDILGKVPACLSVKENALSVIVPNGAVSSTFCNP
jgi:YegS/Rv2252/BmrU family lipid kinase